MTYSETMEHFFNAYYTLATWDLHFPDPIGTISPIDILLFWSIAYMLADSISMVASRRD